MSRHALFSRPHARLKKLHRQMPVRISDNALLHSELELTA
jgi:hypothetical protein